MKKSRNVKLIYDYENYTIAHYEDDVVVVRFTSSPCYSILALFVCIHFQFSSSMMVLNTTQHNTGTRP